jgi:hypothetical protein
MSYQSKYLKYKTKYLELKKQLGGTEFNDLKYLGKGAENVAFKMPDGKILRVRKSCEELLSSEKNVMEKLAENKPKYFAMVYSVGKCADLKKKKLQLATSMCNVSEGELCDYDYVIMDDAPGTNFLIFFLQHFKDLVMNNDFDAELEKVDVKEKIQQFARNSAEYIIKIIDGLMDANAKLGNFKHGDLNYRNCHIDESFTPTIFDYGASKVGVVSPRNQCSDIFNYIKGILSDINLDDGITYNAGIPELHKLESVEKNKVIKNIKVVRKQFRQYAVFNNLCSNYLILYEYDEGEQGITFSVNIDRPKIEKLKLDELKSLIISWM